MLTKFLLKACPLTTLGVALALTSPIASAQDETSNISQAGAVEITADHADSTGDFVSVKVKYALDVRLADGLTVHMDASVVPAGDPDQDATLSSEEAFIAGVQRLRQFLDKIEQNVEPKSKDNLH